MTELSHRFSFTLRPRPPYDFALTMQKPAGWPLFTPREIFDREKLWTAFHVKKNLAGIKLGSRGTTDKPIISVDAFLCEAPTLSQKREIRDALRLRLAIDQDLEPFYRVARKDPILEHTVKDLYGLHGTEQDSVFSGAALAILLQMAPMKRSTEMIDCIIRSFGDPAEFDGKKVFAWPTPEKIAGLKLESLNKCKLGYRSKRLLQLARVMKNKELDIEDLKRMPPREQRSTLLELPGIGDYSADIISSGFPIDAWSVRNFGKLFHGRETKEGREAIEKIKAEGIRRWGEFAWLAFVYVVNDLEGLSRQLGISLHLH